MADMTLKDGLQAMDIAEYLRKHPLFLKDFPELAMSLSMPREHGPASSLASYQVDVLRSKNRALETRLTELIEIAEDNEQLMVRVHSLTMGLLRSDSLIESIRSVVAGLIEDFDTDLVRVLLLRERGDLPEADWLLVESGGIQALPAFAEFLARVDPMVGRLAQDKLVHLFGEHAPNVQSAALMRLGEYGMLAIGSLDGNRFHPGMGSVFLKLIAESVTASIRRFTCGD